MAMTYRNDVDALAARHAALETEVERKKLERDAASRLLEEAREHAKLPLLDNIRLATPCGVKWAQMTGDDRQRMCGQCDKHVYNLSGMTRDEAQALLIEKEGNLCARFFQRSDGTILLADCLIGKKQKRRRMLVVVGASAALASGGIAYGVKRNLERLAYEPPRIELVPLAPLPVELPNVPTETYSEVAGGISVEPMPPPPPVKAPVHHKAPHK